MLSTWIDSLQEDPYENIDDAVAFAIFVFNRLESIKSNNIKEVCQLYLGWRTGTERILRQSKAALHRVDCQPVLERLYKQVDQAKLVDILQSETDAQIATKQRHNSLLEELKFARKRIHA